jgi:transposase
MLPSQGWRERVTRLGVIVVILDLHRQGAGVSAIARRTALDRKTVRKVIAGGLEPPIHGPRPRGVTQLQSFEPYLRERRRFLSSPGAACTASSRGWVIEVATPL